MDFSFSKYREEERHDKGRRQSKTMDKQYTKTEEYDEKQST